MPHFEIAIVDSNILAAMGLQQILADMIPGLEVQVFTSFDELQAADQGQFVHYFVASRIYFEHASFFREGKHRAIVLVNGDLQVAGVPTLNVCQSEAALVKALLAVHRQGHPHGAPMPPHPHGAPMSSHPHAAHGAGHPSSLGAHRPGPPSSGTSGLSSREVEVAILLAKGLINKEIADRLHISITTVITHRKNIMEKLRARSLADIIIYVVMNGLVDVGEL